MKTKWEWIPVARSDYEETEFMHINQGDLYKVTLWGDVKCNLDPISISVTFVPIDEAP